MSDEAAVAAESFAWLEDDSPESLAWQAEQDAATVERLRRWAGYRDLRERLAAYLPPAVAPVPAGGRWFSATGHGLEVSDAPTGGGRVLLAPGDRALDWFYPSPDGRLVAVGLSERGFEQSVLHVVEAATGSLLEELIPFASFGRVAWLPDSTGFYYSAGTARDTENAQKHIWFHRIGEPPPAAPEPVPSRVRFCVPQVSADGRYVTCHPSEVEPRPDHLLDRRDGGGWRPFLRDLEGMFVGCFHEDRFIAVTSDGADRGRVVAIPADAGPDRSRWTELIPESDAVLRALAVVAGRLVVLALEDTCARVRIHALDGSLEEELPLGATVGLEGGAAWAAEPPFPHDGERFSVVVSTPTASGTSYAYDVPARRLTRLHPPARALDGATVRRIEGAWVIHRGELDRPRPTLLHAYAGWNAALMPTWPGFHAAIVDAGGVLAIANLRGGGELGDAFWRDGRLEHKQHCFDDLFAVAERLIDEGITSPDRLAFTGASNGGMVAAAAVAQRPDLWKAVAALVPVTDMVRYARDDFVAQGIEEVGDDPETLAAWSPYQRVTPGARYPATLVACAGDDVRCPPWHSRIFVAALQEASSGDAPIMLRAWPGASHLGVFYDAELAADWVGFVMEHIGLT